MMYTKKIFAFAIIFAVSMEMLTSCFNKEGVHLNNMVSSENTNILELITTIYDEPQLEYISTLNCTINELNDCFPVECMRKEYNHYRVSYVGENKYLVILFDENGNWVLASTYKAFLSLSDFKTIEKGQSLDEVMRIDPNGEYLFLYTGRNDAPRTSRHFSIDGYLITITYSYNTIDDIQIELL